VLRYSFRPTRVRRVELKECFFLKKKKIVGVYKKGEEKNGGWVRER